MKKVKIITTDYYNNKFWEETESNIKEIGSMNVINIYPEITKHIIKGFGGAFTEASAYNYSFLNEKNKNEFLKAYFTQEGLNYNLARTHINSCDFSLGNYVAVEDESDKEFQTFNLNRERQYMLPLIKDAYKISENKITFLLSPWSPPAYMKTNNEMNNGGKLKKECYESWARYIAKYIKEFRNEGLDIEYLTIQNEPEAVQTWDSCIYTAKEELDFIKNYLYPIFIKENLTDIKILIWDHNKEVIYERTKPIFDDEEARKIIYGIAIHWYTGDHFEGLNIVKNIYPEKEIFFTEGCVEYSRFGSSDEIEKAQMYAHDMIGNFNNGVSAFIDWNLLLDFKGGPNHVGNFCAAPIMVKENKEEIEKRLSYYYIGHMSKYIKVGAKIIGNTKYCADIDVLSVINHDGEKVIVLLNRLNENKNISIREYGLGVDINLPKKSIVTVCI